MVFVHRSMHNGSPYTFFSFTKVSPSRQWQTHYRPSELHLSNKVISIFTGFSDGSIANHGGYAL